MPSLTTFCQRLDRLLDRHVGIEAVRLVEVDVIGLQAGQRGVDLLGDLGGGEAAIVRVVGHLPPDLGGEDVAVARAAGEDLPPGGLGGAAAVDVGGVEEVDADLEGGVGAGAGLVGLDAAGVGQPRPEGDLRYLEVRTAELAITHGSPSSRGFRDGLPDRRARHPDGWRGARMKAARAGCAQ